MESQTLQNLPCWTILAVEDDPDDRILIEEALEEAANGKVTVHFVGDGEALLDALRSPQQRPDLVLLDLNLPRLDGRAALQRIKGDPNLRSTPVVILSTSGETTDVDFCYAQGANSFLTKPTSFEALVELFRSLSLYWFETVRRPSNDVSI